jgi:transcriptional regulator with XRE-family HTH domain
LVHEERIEKGFSVRKFAELVGINPTYLSQVEQGNVGPPTVERVIRMAKLLGVNSDEWIVLARRLPEDLPAIIQKHPTKMPCLLRDASGVTIEQQWKLREQFHKLRKQAQKRNERGDGLWGERLQ